MEGFVLALHKKPQSEDNMGLPKLPQKRLEVKTEGVLGDFNHYRTAKKSSTLDRAISIYPVEMLNILKSEGWPVQSGDLGENITTQGVSYEDYSIHSIWTFGHVKLQITEPIHPCYKLGTLPYVGKEKTAEFLTTLKGRRGWYAKVLEQGLIALGDSIRNE